MSSTQWANIGEDAGALHALAARVADHVQVPLIDCLWIFPPRRIAAGESVVFVVAATEDDDRRRVITAHFTIARNRKGAATVGVRFDEHGAAPADAVPRIVQGVLRRMGEDADAEPRDEQIGGSQERWDELILELGGRPRPADEPAQNDDPRDGADPGTATGVADAPETGIVEGDREGGPSSG
jgi:hypothetical protein